MYQRIIVMGNLGGDPEMRYMPDGRAVTNFSLATSRKWTDKASGETRQETTWFRISVWGRQAENANQYLSRGRQVLIEGRLKPDGQTGGPRMFTRQDGSQGASFEIVADVVRFVGNRGDSDGGGQGGYENQSVHETEDDEIPF